MKASKLLEILLMKISVHPPKLGNRYYSSVPAVEQFSSVQKVYGYMEVMAGVISGHIMCFMIFWLLVIFM